jgi:polyisoprenoid-binding protein YceI
MRKVFALLALVAVCGLANAQTWKLDAAHSSITFAVDHMVVSETVGKFGKFDVEVAGTKDDFSDAVISAKAEVASINTDNERRDGHLKSADFFDAEKFPTIEFKNGKLEKISGNKYALKGDLTMHGVTKPVTFDCVYKGNVSMGPMTKAGFKAQTAVNRKDYGVSWSKSLDNGGAVVADEVRITVNIELNKQAAAPAPAGK